MTKSIDVHSGKITTDMTFSKGDFVRFDARYAEVMANTDDHSHVWIRYVDSFDEFDSIPGHFLQPAMAVDEEVTEGYIKVNPCPTCSSPVKTVANKTHTVRSYALKPWQTYE